jgi:GAF domain-containing protein
MNDIPQLRADSLEESATIIDLVDRSGVRDPDIPSWQYRLTIEIARAIADADGTSAALTALLRTVCREAGWAIGQAWVPDESGQHLLVAAFFSGAPALDAFALTGQGTRMPRGTGVPGTVWETGLPVWVEDVVGRLSPAREHAALRCGLRAGAAFPITSDGRFVAVAEFFFLEARKGDRLALLRAAAVGREIGPLIEARDRAAGTDV